MARSNVRHRRHPASSAAPSDATPGPSGDDQRPDAARHDVDASGLTVQGHPAWPDIPTGQGELFFECTLFLYSVLALFLQYLNLYKTLWWLPKSYWHYSMKLHLINPYLLSCVGLLLGIRVTRCFWNTISFVFATLLGAGWPRWMNVAAVVAEYGVIKTPLFCLVVSSFFFSFGRVYHDFPSKTLLYFGYAVFAFSVTFTHEAAQRFGLILGLLRRHIFNHSVLHRLELLLTAIGKESQLVDLEMVTHMCSENPGTIREEVDILYNDFYHRVKHCIFVGVSTAYFSIFVPCVFTPEKTQSGMPQEMLVDYVWVAQLAVVVACTTFSLYVAYLFPLHYCDLLHRSAWHLGHWQPFDDPKALAVLRAEPPTEWSPERPLFRHGDVCAVDGHRRFIRAVAARRDDAPHSAPGVAADPHSAAHRFFQKFAADCTRLPTFLCCFQLALIAFQFWLLLLTTDFIQIATLVLLAFTNYLLLAKAFKDRVVISRIYRPSAEDLQLIEQLKAGG
ncbi:hypothetical protein QR680_009337 [Steinernema hermaphroditum]|uniref:Transmembrane protein 39A n=1 Tax=Steinernema hermaphroditum TaxID=289476 RepID=A0AA39M8P3_9BILA|nr:hypothetical protein QR680_009337 [Steinernema hermaphroditum]